MQFRLFAATAAAVLLAGAASAQPATPAPAGDAPHAPPPAAADQSAAPAPPPAAADQSAAPAPAAGYNARPSANPADLTTAKAGDPNVVSNGPVPDTPENRAKYGKPDSHAGKVTKPAGN